MSKRFLLTTWDGAGNFTPERSLVRALVARGWDAHVLGFDSLIEQVEADGAQHHPLRSVAQSASTDRTRDGAKWVIENVIQAEGYGHDLEEAIRRLKPDLLLVDCTITSALRTAVASGIPTVALVHSIYATFARPPLGPAIDASNVVLVFSYRDFDPTPTFAEKVRFVAPPRPPQPPRLERRPASKRPTIVVSLSTSFQDQGELLQRLCDATAELDADVLVTTGGAFRPEEFRAGPNTQIVSYAPHEAVLPEADLLVTHAGHGTVMAGAGFGVPMICVPMGRDQPGVAAQAERLGLCKVVEPTASVSHLRSVMHEGLADEAMWRSSRGFAASVNGLPGVDQAAAELESLA